MTERDNQISLPTRIIWDESPTDEKCEEIQVAISEDIEEGLKKKRKTAPLTGEGFVTDDGEKVLGQTYW